MADLILKGNELILELSTAEKILAAHGHNIHVPLSCVSSVEVLDHSMEALPKTALRLPGTGIPGTVMIGTFRFEGIRAFVVIHRPHAAGVCVHLEDTDYNELVVDCEDPESVAENLRSHLFDHNSDPR